MMAKIIAVLILCAFAISCYNYDSKFERVSDEQSKSHNDSLNLTVTLNDTVFRLDQINKYLRLRHEVYRTAQLPPHFQILIDSMEATHRPKARIMVNNRSGSIYIAPIGEILWGPASLGGADHALQFDYGKQGSDTVLNDPSHMRDGKPTVIIERYSPYKPNDPGYFQELRPGQSKILFDSLDFFSDCEASRIPEGNYWLVIFYLNYNKVKGVSNYWTGRIQSDTIRFSVNKP
jgi:hypothetical protein